MNKPELTYTKNEQIMEDLNLPKAQRRLLPLLMMGLSNEDIADALYLTAKGVKFQVGNLYKSTGYISRAQCIAGFAKHGWQFDAKIGAPRKVPKKVNDKMLLSVGISNTDLRGR